LDFRTNDWDLHTKASHKYAERNSRAELGDLISVLALNDVL